MKIYLLKRLITLTLVIIFAYSLPVSAANYNNTETAQTDKFVPQSGVKVKNSEPAEFINNMFKFSSGDEMTKNNSNTKQSTKNNKNKENNDSNKRSYKWF